MINKVSRVSNKTYIHRILKESMEDKDLSTLTKQKRNLVLFGNLLQATRNIEKRLLTRGTFLILLKRIIDYFVGERIYFLYSDLGITESNESKVLRYIIKKAQIKGEIAFDIGSCYGQYAIWLSKSFSQVVAFEPEEKNYKILTMSSRLLRKHNIQALNVAVSDKDGMGRLFIAESIFGHSLLYGTDKNFRLTKIVSLRNIVKHPVDLIKVDVQGAAFEVIKGAFGIMNNIKRWIIELEFFELDRKGELETLLEALHYQVSWLSEQHLYAVKLEKAI